MEIPAGSIGGTKSQFYGSEGGKTKVNPSAPSQEMSLVMGLQEILGSQQTTSRREDMRPSKEDSSLRLLYQEDGLNCGPFIPRNVLALYKNLRNISKRTGIWLFTPLVYWCFGLRY